MDSARSERDNEPDGFLFVCRTARSQHKHGGNVAVSWPKDTPLINVRTDGKIIRESASEAQTDG